MHRLAAVLLVCVACAPDPPRPPVVQPSAAVALTPPSLHADLGFVPTPVLPPPPAIGRFQIVMATAPTTLRGAPVMIDTATGDTWLACEIERKVTMWCDMKRGAFQTGYAKR